jgi:hypothetical protein
MGDGPYAENWRAGPVNALRISGGLQRTVVVTVVAVRAMKVTADAVI